MIALGNNTGMLQHITSREMESKQFSKVKNMNLKGIYSFGKKTTGIMIQ